jgi:hypothetical protein
MWHAPGGPGRCADVLQGKKPARRQDPTRVAAKQGHTSLFAQPLLTGFFSTSLLRCKQIKANGSVLGEREREPLFDRSEMGTLSADPQAQLLPDHAVPPRHHRDLFGRRGHWQRPTGVRCLCRSCEPSGGGPVVPGVSHTRDSANHADRPVLHVITRLQTKDTDRAYRRVGARLFGRFHRGTSVPAIMGLHGTLVRVPWIFMQTVVSPDCALMPPSGRPARRRGRSAHNG